MGPLWKEQEAIESTIGVTKRWRSIDSSELTDRILIVGDLGIV